MVAPTKRYTPRSKRKTKMLTADGSTRAWRRLRDSVPGNPGGGAILHHKVPRYKGGSNSPSNLVWLKPGQKDPDVGRPRGH